MIAVLKKIFLGEKDPSPQAESLPLLPPLAESASVSPDQASDSEADSQHPPPSLQGISKPFVEQSLDFQHHHLFRQSPSTPLFALGATEQSLKGGINLISSKKSKAPGASFRSLGMPVDHQLDFRTQLQPELVQPSTVMTATAHEPADSPVVPVETVKPVSDQFEPTQMNDNDRHNADFSFESQIPQVLNGTHALPPLADVDAQSEPSVADVDSSSLVFTPANSVNLNQGNSSAESFGPIKIYLEQAEIYSREKNWDKAIAACQEALTVQPETAAAYKLWGNILQKMGQTTDAMGYYAKALVIQPEFPEVYANLGSLYANQAQWEEAASYYQKAIELNPRFVGAYRNLAKIWQQLDQPEKQTQCLVCALTLEPERGTAEEYYQLGNRLLDYGHVDQAISFFRASIELDPKKLLACNKLAEALEQQGDWKSAVSYYRQVLDIRTEQLGEPSSEPLTETSVSHQPSVRSTDVPKTDRNEIIIQKLRHQASTENPSKPEITDSPLLAQTQKLLKAAIEKPESDEIRVALGDIYTQQQDWEKAIEAYKGALRLNSKLANVYLKLAKAFNQVGKPIEMAESFYRACRLDASLATGQQYLILGQTFVNQSSFDKAVVCYQHAIQAAPHLLDAYRQLGDVLNRQGKTDEAMAVYRKALTLQSEGVESKGMDSKDVEPDDGNGEKKNSEAP